MEVRERRENRIVGATVGPRCRALPPPTRLGVTKILRINVISHSIELILLNTYNTNG